MSQPTWASPSLQPAGAALAPNACFNHGGIPGGAKKVSARFNGMQQGDPDDLGAAPSQAVCAPSWQAVPKHLCSGPWWQADNPRLEPS